ncbi:MAG: rod-binding protein, partial [Pollutimonas bauzanensis]
MSLVHYTPRPGNTTASSLDFSGLNSLKRGVSAGADAPVEKQKEVARQFEALFIQQMLKQARQSASPTVFDSQQTRLAQSMGDEQMSLQLADPGIGLAQALLNQIRGNQGGDAPDGKAGMPELAASRLPGLRSRIGEDRRNDASSISGLIDLL